MANMHLITGRAGEKHVSAADEGALNTAVFGKGQYVLNEGSKMAATVISNNAVRIADGAAMFNGRYIRLEGYEDLTIESGSQGTYRNDLIVIRYTKDISANTESAKLVVIKGAASSTAVDPVYVSGNILEGAVQADMPLYRIPLDNVNIGTPVALFEMIKDNVGDLRSKQEDTKNLTDSATLSDGDYFPFYDVSASGNRKTLWSNMIAKIKTAIWGTTSGFVKANGSGEISGVSTIPIANGGTGAITRKLAAHNITCIGTNPVTAETDTPTKWAELGSGFAYIDGLGVVVDQPTRYGFIESHNYGNVVIQTWTSYGTSGATFHRSGNAAGWNNSWIQDFNKDNLSPATLDSNGKVTASQTCSNIVEVSAAARTLAASDAGCMLMTRNASATAQNYTITIPSNSDVNIPVGTEIEILRYYAGTVTIAAHADVDLFAIGCVPDQNGQKIAINNRYGVCVLKKVYTNYWIASGDVSVV